MSDFKDHYEKFLSRHYSRGMGGFEAKAAESAAFFASAGLTPKGSGLALDLGAGSGFQSIPLARAGFKVVAIDASPSMLTELAQRAQGLEVRVVEGDMLRVKEIAPGPAELVVCMGDTLAHLNSLAEVERLFAEVVESLAPGGAFALSFRDQSNALVGPDRFLPVYQDETLLFTCFLEYAETSIRVTDLVHVKTETGWTLEKSEYTKLRLRAEQAREHALAAGLRIEREETKRGLVTLVGRKSS
jgi:SAM-dependent methyltransferase